jgi:hypothetical protein
VILFTIFSSLSAIDVPHSSRLFSSPIFTLSAAQGVNIVSSERVLFKFILRQQASPLTITSKNQNAFEFLFTLAAIIFIF